MPTYGIKNGNSRHQQYYRELVQGWQEDADRKARQEKLDALHEEAKAVYRELIAIDPEGGEAWYDDDNNIPAFGSIHERIKLVRARIAELKAERGKHD